MYRCGKPQVSVRSQILSWQILLLLAVGSSSAMAGNVTLKSGALYEGNVGRISSVGEDPRKPNPNSERRPVVIIDDELRFTFVPYHQSANFVETPPKNVQRIRIPQIVATSGRQVNIVGDFLAITPFDDWGHRTYSMREGTGRVDIFQGITEITPTYTKIEGLQHVKNPLIWDMRMATSSLPPTTLRRVLLRAVGAEDKSADSRLRVVQLFIQAELYLEALAELNAILKDFPDLDHLKDQQNRLVQLLAQQVLKDIELRRASGQHDLVIALLSKFPDKDVAGETLLRVRDMLKEYDDQKQQYDRSLELLQAHVNELKDPAMKTKLVPIHEEIKRELHNNTLDRMVDYLRLADDDKMSADQKVALAVSGWMLGSGAAIDNLAVAVSLYEVREAILVYLRSSLVHEREQAVEKIKALEGGSPSSVAKLISQMLPPNMAQPTTEQNIPGLHEVKCAGIEEQPEFSYLVQLPPEYKANKRYPCIVTLNGGGSTELQQIAWWAGDYVAKSAMRSGQASRRGYIVIAPRWQRPLQGEYEYSLREHAAVTNCLRDACRRMSIDTDRVYLSGHFSGGDAAWDIALAHPDLWAGCVMFVPRADRYVRHMQDNARYVPLYFVSGEKDVGTGAEGTWLQENSTELDRYLSDTRTDCTVVVYRGRGRDREGFSDEIQRVFEWMALSSHRRNVAPPKIETTSMRPWDNYFWWLEAEGFPTSSMVLPQAWPQPGARPAQTVGELISKTGRITVNPSSDRITVWLLPELVDFSKPIQVGIGGKEIRGDFKPNVEVILEDVRTRGDRQHPFWARVDWPDRSRKR